MDITKVTRLGPHARWHKGYIGCIHYSQYWHKFSLVLNVSDDGMLITELDAFGEVNHTHEHTIRTHRTAIKPDDAIMTITDFYALLKSNDICPICDGGAANHCTCTCPKEQP